MKTTIFRVGPDYSVAHEYNTTDGVTLDEWCGKTADEFTRAMGREADQIDTQTIGERTIREYTWTNLH